MSKQITPAQIKAVAKYEAANYDKVLLRIPKGKRDIIKDRAASLNKSVNAYITDLIDADINSKS